MFSVDATSRLYNEDLRPAKRELRESLEVVVEGYWEEMSREELGSEKKTSCVLQLQRDWNN
jgi:hypothetical protein